MPQIGKIHYVESSTTLGAPATGVAFYTHEAEVHGYHVVKIVVSEACKLQVTEQSVAGNLNDDADLDPGRVYQLPVQQEAGQSYAYALIHTGSPIVSFFSVHEYDERGQL